MRDAIDAAKNATAPIQLIVANGAQFRTYSVDYHGGLRYHTSNETKASRIIWAKSRVRRWKVVRLRTN